MDLPGPDDDFYSGGGDSVLAARMSARLRQVYPVDIGPGTVLQDPATPAGLADRIVHLVTDHVSELSDAEVDGLLTATPNEATL